MSKKHRSFTKIIQKTHARVKLFFLLEEEKEENIFFLTSVLFPHFVNIHNAAFVFWIHIYWKHAVSSNPQHSQQNFRLHQRKQNPKNNNVKFIKSHGNWYIWKVWCELSWENLCGKKIIELSVFCLSDTEASVFTLHQSVFTVGFWTVD